jgi:hypothetical protein
MKLHPIALNKLKKYIIIETKPIGASPPREGKHWELKPRTRN